MNEEEKKIVSKYMSQIGKKGGTKSKGVLSSEKAREMVKARWAKLAKEKEKEDNQSQEEGPKQEE